MKQRIYPATEDGTEHGNPVLMTRERLREKRVEMGPYTFGAQMLLDPRGDSSQGFRLEWMNYYDGTLEGEDHNKYLLVDPASEKKKESDYTAMAVIGLGPDENYYLLDAVRDRLSLTERADALFALHKRWKPRRVGYEKYGQQADIEHIRDRQRRDNYRFEIVPLGGQMAKRDRIRRLVPDFEAGRWFWPTTLYKTDYEGIARDLVQIFLHEEFLPFPVAMHEDLLDAIARIKDEDLQAAFPRIVEKKEDRYSRKKRRSHGGSYMSA